MQVTDAMIAAACRKCGDSDPTTTHKSVMRAALEAALAEMWQDIEGAPHNQLVILGWNDWRDGHWISDVGYASMGTRTDAGSSISHHGSATHWMPLPPPPMGRG